MGSKIVRVGCRQYLIEGTKRLKVDLIPGVKEGDMVSIDCLFDGFRVVNTQISCKVLNPLVKGEKIVIMKKKRRKGYQKKTGFRAQLTEILVEDNHGK